MLEQIIARLVLGFLLLLIYWFFFPFSFSLLRAYAYAILVCVSGRTRRSDVSHWLSLRFAVFRVILQKKKIDSFRFFLY